ncbi:hypothetical protein X975_22307, partial [Stegodyphus mimosarum]
MGKIQRLSRSTSSSAMDIDPPSASWNSLCPSFLDSRRNRMHLQDDTSGPVIGSPPPAGPPKILWDETFSVDVPNLKEQGNGNNLAGEKGQVMEAELSLRVQEIRLQPPQPMIICETVEDEKVETPVTAPTDTVSLAVPPVDVSNEKKRPPLTA